MPKFKFAGTWTLEQQKGLTKDKGYLLIKYDPRYAKSLAEQLLKLDTWQQKKCAELEAKGQLFQESDWLRELVIDIEYHFKKRTLDQNALMWSLYEIEANEMNGGQKGHVDQTVTPMELYLADLDQWGERETISTKRKHLAQYRAEYRHVELVFYKCEKYDLDDFLKFHEIGDDEPIRIQVARGTSKLDTKEMAQWINSIFNRIAANGLTVTEPGKIEDYWIKWRENLNDEKIILNDIIISQSDYKNLNPICEACGKFIGDGTGELSHIQGFGMGGDRSTEPARNYTSNWLHLCATPCHRDIWHGKGVNEFLKQFRHLTYKVRTALNRNYEVIK